MSYKIYTDKKENFECKIFLEGASLKDAKTRIVVESDSVNLMYNGKIDKDGNCTVPIDKLNSFLKEGDTGNLKLEVIAEDTYFLPWESDFEVSTAKKIKVEVKQQEKPVIKSDKPKMVVKEVKHTFDPIKKITSTLNEQGVTQKNIIENKKKMIPILSEYMKKTGYKKGFKNFIREILIKLSKN
tara:strand:+ start:203 stop:754 length:552 start_codon:yes stop_codon:yes gene_type:complete